MLIERVCLALMLALVGDVFLGVFSRYILQATFQWYDEVARLCFIWIVFLGAAVAVKRGMHFRMRLVAGGYGIYPIAQRQVTDALEISMLWFYAALPVGGALIIFYALQQAWQRTRVPA